MIYFLSIIFYNLCCVFIIIYNNLFLCIKLVIRVIILGYKFKDMVIRMLFIKDRIIINLYYYRVLKIMFKIYFVDICVFLIKK